METHSLRLKYMTKMLCFCLKICHTRTRKHQSPGGSLENVTSQWSHIGKCDVSMSHSMFKIKYGTSTIRTLFTERYTYFYNFKFTFFHIKNTCWGLDSISLNFIICIKLQLSLNYTILYILIHQS